MSTVEKADILRMVETMSRRKRQALSALGIPKSSYYRWRQGQTDSGNRKRPWNRITPEEEDKILATAMESPELSSRQLAAWITDNAGFTIVDRQRNGTLLRPLKTIKSWQVAQAPDR